MNSKGFTVVELVVVLSLFSIAYFVGVSSVSHAFEVDPIQTEYDSIINIIELQAEEYAYNNESLFSEGDVSFIYVKDLIEANYLATDNNGNIVDPLSPNKTLNDLKLKIVRDEDVISASVVTI